MGFNFSLLNSRFTLISLNWVQRWSLLCMCWASVVFISNAVLGCAGGVIGRLHHSRPALYLMSSPVLKVWRQYQCPHLPRVNTWANAEKESEQLRHSCCLLSSHAILWSHNTWSVKQFSCTSLLMCEGRGVPRGERAWPLLGSHSLICRLRTWSSGRSAGSAVAQQFIERRTCINVSSGELKEWVTVRIWEALWHPLCLSLIWFRLEAQPDGNTSPHFPVRPDSQVERFFWGFGSESLSVRGRSACYQRLACLHCSSVRKACCLKLNPHYYCSYICFI